MNITRARELGLDIGPCQKCRGSGCSACAGLGLVLLRPPDPRTPRGDWERLVVQVQREAKG